MRIDQPNKIASDAVGSIRLKTLLGTYQIYVTLGSPTAPPLNSGDMLKTENYKDIQDTLQDLGSGFGAGSKDLFASVNENQRKFFDQIQKVIDENRDNVRRTTSALAEAGPKVNELMDRASRIARKIEEGSGTLGLLMSDDKLYGQIRRVADNAEKFTASLNNGQGTLSRLVTDPALGDKLDATLTNAQAATGKVRGILERNEADIDKAIKAAGGALPKFEKGMDQFISIGAKIDRGDGTLGKLVNDPELYNSVRDAVGQIRRTFEEGEEQGVMRTFMGVFFGSAL
jgi:phospholipid/cholesterol/gamma-HCH transport system substrate-binding protein